MLPQWDITQQTQYQHIHCFPTYGQPYFVPNYPYRASTIDKDFVWTRFRLNYNVTLRSSNELFAMQTQMQDQTLEVR